MRSNPQRRCFLVSALLFLCLVWDWNLTPSRVFSDSDTPQDKLLRAAQFWKQPHHLHVSGSNLNLDLMSQGGDNWQIAVGEVLGKAAAFASRTNGGDVELGLTYDSAKSNLSLPTIPGMKRVIFNTAAQASEVDWTLQVEADKRMQLSVAGDTDTVIYDASLATETNIAKNLNALYAVDVKRRKGVDGYLPTWMRQGAGIRYTSKLGDLKLIIHQPDPDANIPTSLDFEAILKGKINAFPRTLLASAPQYVIRASQLGYTDTAYSAQLKFPAKHGISAGIDANFAKGVPSYSGYAEFQNKRKVMKGIEVSLDTKVNVDAKGGHQEVSVQPIGIGASLGLGQLLPGLFNEKSGIEVRSRYRPGAERPALALAARLQSKKLPLQLTAASVVGDDGKASSSLRFIGSMKNGIQVQYETSSSSDREFHQSAELLLPFARIKGGSARAVARVFDGTEHGGTPRFQLGVQYDAGQSKRLRVDGESAYDSGYGLVKSNGRPMRKPQLQQLKNTAAVLKKRINSDYAAGQQWLSK